MTHPIFKNHDFFFDNRKTRSPFVWEEKRFHLIEQTSSREFVELKIKKLFFFELLRILIFSNFSSFWRDINELEEIDKVEVKKRTGYFKLLTGRHVIMSSVPNDIEFGFCRTKVEMNFGRSKTLFEAKIKLIWSRVKFENRFKLK